jgi:hypothetical protein
LRIINKILTPNAMQAAKNLLELVLYIEAAYRKLMATDLLSSPQQIEACFELADIFCPKSLELLRRQCVRRQAACLDVSRTGSLTGFYHRSVV